jgi:hypothetical protein
MSFSRTWTANTGLRDIMALSATGVCRVCDDCILWEMQAEARRWEMVALGATLCVLWQAI